MENNDKARAFPNLLRWPFSMRRHEVAPAAKDGMLEGFPSKATWEGECVWLSAMLAGCFLDTMAGVIFFFPFDQGM